MKGECIRVKTPLDLEEARRVTSDYVQHYNEVRLHSAVGYITPADRLAKRHQEILEVRKHKLIEARKRRESGKGKLPLRLVLLEWIERFRMRLIWAEGRATWRHDPSVAQRP